MGSIITKIQNSSNKIRLMKINLNKFKKRLDQKQLINKDCLANTPIEFDNAESSNIFDDNSASLIKFENESSMFLSKFLYYNALLQLFLIIQIEESKEHDDKVSITPVKLKPIKISTHNSKLNKREKLIKLYGNKSGLNSPTKAKKSQNVL